MYPYHRLEHQLNAVCTLVPLLEMMHTLGCDTTCLLRLVKKISESSSNFSKVTAKAIGRILRLLYCETTNNNLCSYLLYKNVQSIWTSDLQYWNAVMHYLKVQKKWWKTPFPRTKNHHNTRAPLVAQLRHMVRTAPVPGIISTIHYRISLTRYTSFPMPSIFATMPYCKKWSNRTCYRYV